MSQKLIAFLENHLQSADIQKGNEAAFYCPNCNHYKKKLVINLDTKKYHCWVCDFKGKSLFSLFKKLGKQHLYKELSEILEIKYYNVKKDDLFNQNKKIEQNTVSLPKEFESLFIEKNNPEYKNAIRYLLRRNITKLDILKYNIGYCEYGKYAKRIIIPSYNNFGLLNFFTSRAYYDVTYLKYINPDVSKNIIGFELFINWNQPINIVEGPFDALAIKTNVIPLYGKIIQPKLKEEIIKRKVKRINLILDDDATKEAMSQASMLISCGVDVHLIRLQDKDPSVIGFENMQKIINKSKPLEFLDIMKYKLFE